MAPNKEYLDDDESYGPKKGKQPEEISMMPKIGWSEGKGDYARDDYTDEELSCGAGPCKPGFLQSFKKVWLFALISGLTSLFAEYVHVYLVSQIPYLKRQFDLGDNASDLLSLPSPIASLFTVLFLSVIARRVNLPRALALTSLFAGICSLLCIIPHIHTHQDMTPAPAKNETKKFTVDKLMFEMPSCVYDRIDKDLREKAEQIMTADFMSNTVKQIKKSKKKPAKKPNKPAPKPAAIITTAAAPLNTDSGGDNPTTAPPGTTVPTTITTVAQGSGVTIMMVDFEKLSTHKNYETLKSLALTRGIDMEKVRTMTLQEQVAYLDSLDPETKAMLPSLRVFLGDNPDDYFFSYELPVSNSRRRRHADDEGDDADAIFEENRKKLKNDPLYNGMMAYAMRNMVTSKAALVKLFKAACPFNTHPFHQDNHSGMVVALLVVAMILHRVVGGSIILDHKTVVLDDVVFILLFLSYFFCFQGIAVAPRMAFVVTFIIDNTKDTDTAKHLGVFTALASFGPLVAVLVGFNSMTTYITLEDKSEYMTFLNPRWLPAWWVGFLILGIITCFWSIPIALFPRAIMPSRKYVSGGQKEDNSGCLGIVQALRGLFPSLFRLMTNQVYVLLLLGATLSHMAWAGVTSVIINYFSHQFSLPPMEPGFKLYSIYGILVVCGTILGGFLSSKFKMSSITCLKMAVGLSLVLVVSQGLNIGFGCDQPEVSKGERVDPTKANMTCGQLCRCFDLGYSPVCGSDGITYYSPCHAGCGYPHKGKFYDCQCLSDTVKTATPNFCEQPCMWAYWLFQVVFLIGAFALGVRFVPLLVSSYRCVDSQDIPVAIGLKMFYAILFCYIAAPYIYRNLEEATCTLDRPECGILPTCAIHDIVSYRLKVFVTSFVLELVGALLLVFAFLLGKRSSSKFNERVSDHK